MVVLNLNVAGNLQQYFKGYSLDNCKWATRKEQSHNQRIQKNNNTGSNGISWNKKIKKYHAYIANDRKRIHLGFFDHIKDAIIARKAGEVKYWGFKQCKLIFT